MMVMAFRKFPQSGVVALFHEAPGGGDPHDINSLRNRPALHPEDWLASVLFHSSLDNLEVHDSSTVTVSHASVSSGSAPSGFNSAFGWNAASADHLLMSHSLGYVPFVLVATGNNIIWPGMPVQTGSNGAARYASVYATTTQVRLYEWASVGSSTLSAISLDYDVLIFKNPPAASGSVLEDFAPGTGIVTMGRGKFNTSRRYLQVVAGGTPLGLALGRTIDLNNGAIRAYRSNGTYYEPVPATLKAALQRDVGYGYVYGGDMGYAGSYAAPTSIQVQAP